MLGAVVGAAAVAACLPGEPQPRKLSEKEALEFSLDQPTALDDISFRQSKKGKPEDVGCADGQREGFANLERFPNVAGCLARWEGKKNLREVPSKKACGDDMKGKCKAPADACAPGWHLCGFGGSNQDLAERVTGKECRTEAGPGKFVAAMSHLQEPKVCPPIPTAETVFEMPLVVAALAKMQVLSHRTLLKFWRVAIVLIFILAAFLTPPEPVTQFMMALPMVILFFTSVLVAFILNPAGRVSSTDEPLDDDSELPAET